jgi:lipopolysaccharide export LptBFGC system permease protein LptF
VVILPITTFIVVLFVYVRMNSDRELVVMRAAGLSQLRLARPGLVLALAAVGMGYLLNLWLVPLSHTSFRMWQFEIRNQMAAILLQEASSPRSATTSPSMPATATATARCAASWCMTRGSGARR